MSDSRESHSTPGRRRHERPAEEIDEIEIAGRTASRALDVFEEAAIEPLKALRESCVHECLAVREEAPENLQTALGGSVPLY